MFTNREIAVTIWLGVVLLWSVTKPPIRTSLLGVIRAFFAWKILASVTFLATCTVAAVWLLHQSGFWTLTILKETVLWFCLTGLVLMFSAMTSDHDENVLQASLRDSVKFIIVFEFLVSEYTFPLAAELVLVPVLTFIAMVNVVAESREEHASAAKLLGWVQAIAGLAILIYAVRAAASDLATLNNFDTARKILVAPVLSILLAPAIYMVLLVSTYETLFLRLRWPERDRDFLSFAKRRLIGYLGLSVRRIRAFMRGPASKLTAVRTREELELLLAEDRESQKKPRAAA